MLWLPTDAYDEIIKDSNKWNPLETGGVFMGYIAKNDDIVVTDIIDCGDNSKHNRYSFDPDQKYQLNEICDIYQQSKGLVTYLGDWHTHPSGTTNLSNRDKRTLVKIATTPEAKVSKPLMGILGGHSEQWVLNVVQFTSGEKSIWPFINCNYDNLPYVLY